MKAFKLFRFYNNGKSQKSQGDTVKDIFYKNVKIIINVK